MNARSVFAVVIIPEFALQAALRHEPELHERAVALLDLAAGHPERSAGGHRGYGAQSKDDESRCIQHRTSNGPLIHAAASLDVERWTLNVGRSHEDQLRRATILHCTPAARAAGITPGMTSSQAEARRREVLVRFRSPDAERNAQAALIESAFGVSSFVEDTAPGLCTFEVIASASREFSSEQIARQLINHLAVLHLRAQIGFAPNPDLARLAAESAAPIRHIQRASELHELPLTTLAPPAAILDILQRWGIHMLGAFVALGRESLVARLGPEILPLYDRAAGRVVRPLRCLQPAETFEESIEIEHEIETVEPLLFLLRRFLEQIARRLEAIYRVAAELVLRLGLSGGGVYEHAFKIPSPTCQVDTLFRMLETHLDGLTTDEPIVRLQLIAHPARPVRQQFGLFESALRDPNQFAETLARLVAMLGHERVGTPVLEPTHRPDAFHLRPADFTASTRCASAAALPLGLALRRFRPPIPALVQCDPGPVFVHASTTARGRITAAYGPMLLSGDWWASAEQAWSRCEWDVQLEDGPLCRIFEQGGSWFLEGFYD